MVLCIILHTYVLDDTQEHHLSVLKLLHVSYVLYVFCIGCFRTLLTCSTNKTLHVLNLNTGVLLHSLNTSNMFWKCYILVFYLVFYSGTLIFRVYFRVTEHWDDLLLRRMGYHWWEHLVWKNLVLVLWEWNFYPYHVAVPFPIRWCCGKWRWFGWVGELCVFWLGLSLLTGVAMVGMVTAETCATNV